jgi:hypothetical protein
MKTTKNTFLIFVFLLASVATNGQQIYLEAGFGDAFFEDYVNDLGENTLDDTYSKAKRPFIEGGLRFDIYKEDRLLCDYVNNQLHVATQTRLSPYLLKYF